MERLLKSNRLQPFHSIDFKGIDEKNYALWLAETRRTLSSMYHIPILLFWDQDIATPPRTLPESDKRSYRLCQFIDTSRYLSMPHVILLKLFPTEPYREYFHVIFKSSALFRLLLFCVLCGVTKSNCLKPVLVSEWKSEFQIEFKKT